MDDFHNSMVALVEGGSDPFFQDQYIRTALHSFNGPTSSLRWLKRQEALAMAELSPQEFADLLSLRTYDEWDSSFEVLTELLPEGNITPEIAQCCVQDRRLVTDGSGSTLLQHSSRWELADIQNHSSIESWQKLLLDLFKADRDLHAIMGSETLYTVLSSLIHSLFYTRSFKTILRNAKRTVKGWLAILYRAGVDLAEYGRIENELHANGRTNWTFDANIESVKEFDNICRFKMIELRIGATPDDLYIEFEDLYVSASLAARFWKWVERPVDEDQMASMPGSWQDD